MALTSKQKAALAASMATAIAVPAEGLRQWAYYDPPGILTVCYGHTGPDVVKGRKYSLAECEVHLTNDMRKAIEQVQACHPDVPVPVLASFGDAVYNMGRTIACDRRNSTAARYLYAKDYTAACNQLPRWDKARVLGVMVSLPGLTTRRARERELCLTWSQA